MYLNLNILFYLINYKNINNILLKEIIFIITNIKVILIKYLLFKISLFININIIL